MVDEATYWDLQNAIGAAQTLAELRALGERLQSWPLDDRRRQLSEALFMQEHLLACRQAVQADPGAA
jgi:hypothetical protein